MSKHLHLQSKFVFSYHIIVSIRQFSRLFSKYHLIHPLHKQRLQGEANTHKKLGIHVGLLQQGFEYGDITACVQGQPRHVMTLFLQQVAQEVAGMEVVKSIAYAMVVFRPHIVSTDSFRDLRQRTPCIGSFLNKNQKNTMKKRGNPVLLLIPCFEALALPTIRR